MAQRLGRRVCANCATRGPIPEATRHRLSPSEQALFADGSAWRGTGCERCAGTGLRGRVGYYEVALTTPSMRESIAARASTQTLLRTVGPEFVSMRRDGLMKAAQGATTIEQVLGATQDADEPVG
jgi:type IV pilus assembly protein PilB